MDTPTLTLEEVAEQSPNWLALKLQRCMIG